MGNSESVPDDTHDESPYQPSSYADTCHPSYAGSSMDPNYQRKHESHPSSNARSSADPDHQGKRQVPFIADNYSSLDEVLVIPELCICRLYIFIFVKDFLFTTSVEESLFNMFVMTFDAREAIPPIVKLRKDNEDIFFPSVE